MNYKVLKNGELLRVHSCKVYPKPYNSTEHMEYVMFNVDDREEIVIESETEIYILLQLLHGHLFFRAVAIFGILPNLSTTDQH